MKLLQLFPPYLPASLSAGSSLIFAKWLFTSKWSCVLSKWGSATFSAPTSQSFKFPLSSNFLWWENHSWSLLLPHSLNFFLTVSASSNYLIVPLILYLNDLLCLNILSSKSHLFFQLILMFFFFLINLFIYFWLHWVFVAVCGLSLVAVSWGYSSLRCTGFSLRWLLLLRSMGSRRAGFSSCDSRALEHRLSSCGSWT